MIATSIPDFFIRQSNEKDVPLILRFIRELADYEKLLHAVSASEENLKTSLYGTSPTAEVVIAEYKNQPVGFALFFHNYSTFLGKWGLYLEDLYIQPAYRKLGLGKALVI